MWLHMQVTESRAALQLCFLPCGELHSAKLIILVFNTEPFAFVAKHWCHCCVPARRASDKTATCRKKNRANTHRFPDESERTSVWHLRCLSHLDFCSESICIFALGLIVFTLPYCTAWPPQSFPIDHMPLPRVWRPTLPRGTHIIIINNNNNNWAAG